MERDGLLKNWINQPNPSSRLEVQIKESITLSSGSGSINQLKMVAWVYEEKWWWKIENGDGP